MKVFCTINLKGSRESLEAVIGDITTSLRDGWSRSVVDEERLSQHSTLHRYYCFSCPAIYERPAATIFLIHKDDTEIEVANILPLAHGSLSYDEYNRILRDFFEQYIQPNAAERNIEAERSAENEELENWLSDDAARLLRFFSRSANKRSGSSHPSDRHQWYRFLIAAFEADNHLASSTLERWLREEGWDEEQADKLAREYDFAQELLSQYADSLSIRI